MGLAVSRASLGSGEGRSSENTPQRAALARLREAGLRADRRRARQSGRTSMSKGKVGRADVAATSPANLAAILHICKMRFGMRVAARMRRAATLGERARRWPARPARRGARRRRKRASRGALPRALASAMVGYPVAHSGSSGAPSRQACCCVACMRQRGQPRGEHARVRAWRARGEKWRDPRRRDPCALTRAARADAPCGDDCTEVSLDG